MTTKIKFQVYLFFLILFSIKIFANNDIIIYNETQTTSDTINFGVTILNETSTTSFIIKNNSERKIQLGFQAPSYILGRPPGYDKNDFEEFAEIGKPLLVDINPNDSFKLVIQYTAKPDLVNYPPGRKWAYLLLGIYDPQITPVPTENDIIYERKFILTAVKTTKALDCYDNKIHFDSVYVNPKVQIQRKVIIESSTNKSVVVDSHYIKPLNPYIDIPKFFVQEMNYPIIFPNKRSYKDWIISYIPNRTGKDSALFSVYYKPDFIGNPNLIDSVLIKLYGIGVEQKLILLDCNYPFSNDTIFIGDVFVNAKKEINVIIKNIGNIPFGVKSQNILDLYTQNISEIFKIEKPFLQNGQYLFENKQDTLKFSLTPTKIGNINAQLVIESDIFTRKIQGAPKEIEKFIINLQARGVEPIINSSTNYIDFGNIFIHSDCPNTVDTTILIANNGNIPLEIYDITFDPAPPSPFSVEPTNLIIEPKSQQQIKITFSTLFQPIGVEILSNMQIISNCREPNNIYSIQLKAKGIEPLNANISLPNITSSAGREILIPLIADKNKISFSNTFSCSILYDKTLLKYINWFKINTASENAENITIIEENGKLNIKIQLPAFAKQRFLERDTLIILKFRTYLGENISTPLTIINPQFGDENCDNILNLNVKNGIFSLDSICGLNFKAVPFPKGTFQIINITPNPVSADFTLEFELPYKLLTEINLYKYTGEKLKTIAKQIFESGKNSISISVDDIQSGLYFIELNIGTNFDIKPLFIIK